MVGDEREIAQVRVVNLNEGSLRLTRDQVLGSLHPVEVEQGVVSKEGRGRDSDDFSFDALLEDLPEEVRPDDRAQLGELLLEYLDVLSMAEGGLGRTAITTHKIHTGDARPVRQPLRRQPLPHRTAVNEHLDSKITVRQNGMKMANEHSFPVLLVFFAAALMLGCCLLANQKATSVAIVLVNTIVVRCGAPLLILTDQGMNFDGNLFRVPCGLLSLRVLGSHHEVGEEILP